MRVDRRIRYATVIALIAIFLVTLGYGISVLVTPLGYVQPRQVTGHGKVVNSDGSNTTLLLEEETFTARGCFCATNPITVQIIFKNATAFPTRTLVRYNAFAFNSSQNVPPQPAGAGFDNSTQTGELPLFQGTAFGFTCPVGAMCVYGTLSWTQPGSTWGYFIVNNTVHGLIETSLVAKGTSDLTIEDSSYLSALQSAKTATAQNWIIIALTIGVASGAFSFVSRNVTEAPQPNQQAQKNRRNKIQKKKQRAGKK
jgi:hypothetical protein